MTIGINLGGVQPYTPEVPLIDRMLMAAEPATKTGSDTPVGPYNPATALPSGPGTVVRQFPIDPGAHDYVVLCDANVSRVFVGGIGMTPVVPVNGRATFSTPSTAVGGSLPVSITATGPVSKFSILRADHEAAFQRQRWNPDFLTKASPFKIIRFLDWNSTTYEFGTPGKVPFPTQRPLPTDAYFTTEKGGMPAEFVGDLLSTLGADGWYTVHAMMPDAMMTDVFKALDATAGNARIRLEYGDELGWTYLKQWVPAQVTARYGIAKPGPNDIRRWNGYRAGMMALLAAKVSDRFKVVLCSQPTNTPADMASMLAGWDESGAPRSLIDGISNASYLNFNANPVDWAALVALWQANNVQGVYDAVQAKLAPMASRHKAMADWAAAQGLAYHVYEAGVNIVANAPAMTDPAQQAAFVAWMAPIYHSPQMGDLLDQNIEGAFAAGAADVLPYQLTGAGTKYGFWGLVPHISQASYPAFGVLTSRIAAAAATASDYAALAAEVAAMQKQLADLMGRIAAAATS